MNVYLTDPELQREENLFAPHQESYAILEGSPFDIRTYVDVTEGEDIPQIPSSC
jgi:hypothetical protein